MCCHKQVVLSQHNMAKSQHEMVQRDIVAVENGERAEHADHAEHAEHDEYDEEDDDDEDAL